MGGERMGGRQGGAREARRRKRGRAGERVCRFGGWAEGRLVGREREREG